MRTVLGWFCYFVGGGIVIFSLQLTVNCEIIAALGKAESYTFDFWQFLYHTSGHHKAYPSGYLIHWLRDISIFLFGILIIRMGREQFIQKHKIRAEKSEITQCPNCKRKTLADAYCRFCGFNLVTHEPSLQAPVFMPLWKVTLLAYMGLSLLLLILNFVLTKLGWGY